MSVVASLLKGALPVVVPGSEDIAPSEEICALYYADGDPTEGHRSQNATLFVDQKASMFALEGFDGTQIEVSQQSDQLRHAGVTGCVVWNGAVVLARSLAAWVSEPGGLLELKGLKVLELGAGTGALAVACALLGARVLATEQAERLKLLHRNVERHALGSNSGVVAGGPPWSIGRRGGTVDIQELDWFSPGPPLDCDLILATDVVYTEEVTQALVACLASYAVPIILSVELRTEEVHFAFVEALAAAEFVVHRLPAELHAPEVRTRRVVTYVLGRGEKSVAESGCLR